MFNQNTVLIVGAGASSEFNLPTGGALKTEIAKLLDIQVESFKQTSGDPTILEAFRRASKNDGSNGWDAGALVRSGHSIKNAMPISMSIDNYLDAHRDDPCIELCGKLAISKAILAAERLSSLYYDPNNEEGINFQLNEATWITAFFKLLTENCQHRNLAERLRSISLIVFNYDRCIEHYLVHALQTYYQIKQSLAAELVSEISIYHPYGKVGELPSANCDKPVAFGADPSSERLLEIAGQLRTFTESTDPNASEIEAIRSDLGNAKIVVFLGFAYHRLNLELLTSVNHQGTGLPGAKYFGTAHGLSLNDISLIEKDLAGITASEPATINIDYGSTCYKLFGEYWRSFSLA